MTLAAVEETALTAAHAEADRIRGAAQERAERLIDNARSDTAALLERWRVAAAELADLEERRRLAEARARARAQVLAAQWLVRTQAIAAAHVAARGLTGDPRYERLLDRLAKDARDRLSAAGRVHLRGCPGGGFVARAGTREIDYSIDAQVERCVQRMAPEFERLWQ